MPVIGICSGKGGVGKTTVSANLSASLSNFGSVIAVDGDIVLPNLHALFGFEPATTLQDVLIRKASLRDAIYHLRIKDVSIDVLPSRSSEKIDGFDDVLRELDSIYDFVLVDIAAGLNVYAITPMMSCDKLYLVLNPEETSIMDAWRVKKVIDKIGVEFGGAIINRYRGEKWAVAIVEKRIGSVVGIIRDSRAIKKSWEKGQIVTALKPEAKVSEEFYELARRIIGENVRLKPYGKLKYLLRL